MCIRDRSCNGNCIGYAHLRKGERDFDSIAVIGIVSKVEQYAYLDPWSRGTWA